jgi:hypothetical protein
MDFTWKLSRRFAPEKILEEERRKEERRRKRRNVGTQRRAQDAEIEVVDEREVVSNK